VLNVYHTKSEKYHIDVNRSKLAYLSFDEQEVKEYEFPIYNPSNAEPQSLPYTTPVIMRYPKPGTPNPIVTLHVFDLARYLLEVGTTASRQKSGKVPEIDPQVQRFKYQLQISTPFPVDDHIVMEVAWMGNLENSLMVRSTDRIARNQRIAHFDLGSSLAENDSNEVIGKVVRDVNFAEIDGGWAEPASYPNALRFHEMTTNLFLFQSQGQFMMGLDNSKTSTISEVYYIDIVPNEKGFNHIAFFSVDAKDPVFLTEGEWEVAGEIQSIDIKRRLMFVHSMPPSSRA
jgi:dipeptidyl aminopeptidase